MSKPQPDTECAHSWIQDSPIKVCYYCGYKLKPDTTTDATTNTEGLTTPDTSKQGWEERCRRDLTMLLNGWVYSRTWGGGHIFDEERDMDKIMDLIRQEIDRAVKEVIEDMIKEVSGNKEKVLNDYYSTWGTDKHLEGVVSGLIVALNTLNFIYSKIERGDHENI